MDLSEALKTLKESKRVANKNWNGKGAYLEMQVPDSHSKMTLPYIYYVFPDDHEVYPGKKYPWLASQLDIMSENWEIV
jgi:hypothetical protein